MKFSFEELIIFGGENRQADYRILLDPNQIMEIPGKNKFFLITPFLFPDYVLLFPRIEAIFTIKGSILSHLAILCREYKIPVFKIKNILDKIPHKGKMFVDYDAKIVTIPLSAGKQK